MNESAGSSLSLRKKGKNGIGLRPVTEPGEAAAGSSRRERPRGHQQGRSAKGPFALGLTVHGESEERNARVCGRVEMGMWKDVSRRCLSLSERATRSIS